jgi:hypothetical protein
MRVKSSGGHFPQRCVGLFDETDGFRDESRAFGRPVQGVGRQWTCISTAPEWGVQIPAEDKTYRIQAEKLVVHEFLEMLLLQDLRSPFGEVHARERRPR